MQSDNTSTSSITPEKCVYTLNNKKLKNSTSIKLDSPVDKIELNINDSIVTISSTKEIIKGITITHDGILIQY